MKTQWLYRSVRWGKHLELFILDTRQYRDVDFAVDSSTQPNPGSTTVPCRSMPMAA